MIMPETISTSNNVNSPPPANSQEKLDSNEVYTIEINKLIKKFDDVTAVNGLDLKVLKGECFGLLGPNGAGKTTVINVMNGLLDPTSGEVKVGGYDVKKKMEEIRKIIGVCPQEPAYFAELTGAENAEFFGRMYGMKKKILKPRVAELFEKLGMEGTQDRRAGKYSGGMIRRMSMIIALINSPDIAFLDEPTVAMDPQSRRQVWNFITDLKKQQKTVILTTHYIEEAEMLCDRVGIIEQGKLIELGTPKDLLKKHQVENLEEVFIKLTGRKLKEDV
jgi:ABC-type multidrug transport system ATPase subunit